MKSLQPLTRKVNTIEGFPFHTRATEKLLYDIIIDDMMIFEGVDENGEQYEYMYILDEKGKLHRMKTIDSKLHEQLLQKYTNRDNSTKGVIEYFQYLLNNHIDTITLLSANRFSLLSEEKHKHGEIPENFHYFKCRRRWFDLIALKLTHHSFQKLLSGDYQMNKDVNDYLIFYEKVITKRVFEFNQESGNDEEKLLGRITSEDIEKANNLLRKVIAYLKDLYPEETSDNVIGSSLNRITTSVDTIKNNIQNILNIQTKFVCADSTYKVGRKIWAEAIGKEASNEIPLGEQTTPLDDKKTACLLIDQHALTNRFDIYGKDQPGPTELVRKLLQDEMEQNISILKDDVNSSNAALQSTVEKIFAHLCSLGSCCDTTFPSKIILDTKFKDITSYRILFETLKWGLNDLNSYFSIYSNLQNTSKEGTTEPGEMRKVKQFIVKKIWQNITTLKQIYWRLQCPTSECE